MSPRMCLVLPVVFAVVASALTLSLGCRHAGDALVEESTNDAPFLWVHRDAGRPDPSGEPRSGLILVLWRDGRIARATSLDDVALTYELGIVNLGPFHEIMRAIHDDLITSLSELRITGSRGDSYTVRTEGNEFVFRHDDLSGERFGELRDLLLSAPITVSLRIHGRIGVGDGWLDD